MSISRRLNLSGNSKRKEQQRHTLGTALNQLALAKQQQALAKQQIDALHSSDLAGDPSAISTLLQTAKEHYQLGLQQARLARTTLHHYIEALTNDVVNQIRTRVRENKDQNVNRLIGNYQMLTQEQLISATTEILLDSEAADDFTITYLGGTNNRSMLVSDQGGIELCVIQLIEVTEAAKQAIDILDGDSKEHTLFLAKTLYEEQFTIGGSADNARYVCLNIVETFTSLEDAVHDLHKYNIQPSDDKAVELATMLGKQIIELLLNLRKEKVIWTDLKPSNILIDNRGHIKITDPKAFLPLSSSYKRNEKGYYDFLINTTEEGLSKNFVRNRDRIQDQDMIVVWMHEYSYQLASILYFICSNQQARNNHKSRKRSMTFQEFDFEQSAFQSAQGQRLRLIIQLLSGQAFKIAIQKLMSATATEDESSEHQALNLDKRITLDDALLLLFAVQSQQDFDTKLNAVLIDCDNKVKQNILSELTESGPIEKQESKNTDSKRGSKIHRKQRISGNRLSSSARLFSDKKHKHKSAQPTLPPLSLGILDTSDELATESESDSEDQSRLHRLRARSGGSTVDRSSKARSTRGSRTERSKQNRQHNSTGSYTSRGGH